MGDWEWDGIRHYWRVLLIHGRRCNHGGRFHEDDRVEGERMAWLGMDDGVDDFVGHAHD